jgi:hypothetical protein
VPPPAGRAKDREARKGRPNSHAPDIKADLPPPPALVAIKLTTPAFPSASSPLRGVLAAQARLVWSSSQTTG